MTPVDEVIAQLHSTRAGLLAQLEQVEQALVAFGQTDTDSASSRSAGAKAAILAALRIRGDEPADIADILHGVLALGWSTTSSRPRNVVASTVAKLARTGEVVKVAGGRYRSIDSVDMQAFIAA